MTNTLLNTQVFYTRCVRGMIALSFVLFGVYAFGILSTISATLQRRSYESQIHDVRAEVADLQASYYDQVKSVREQPLLAYNLAVPTEVSFASTDTTLHLSFNR